MSDLGLFELLTPHYLASVDLGPAVHTLVAALYVDTLDMAWDDSGVVLSGTAKLHGDLDSLSFSIDSSGVHFNVTGTAPPQHPATQAPSGAIFDLHDSTIA